MPDAPCPVPYLVLYPILCIQSGIQLHAQFYTQFYTTSTKRTVCTPADFSMKRRIAVSYAVALHHLTLGKCISLGRAFTVIPFIYLCALFFSKIVFTL